MNIVLHARPGYSIFLRELIYELASKKLGITCCVVLYSNADDMLSEFARALGRENVFYLQDVLNKTMDRPFDAEDMRDFPASLYECVLSTKETAGINSLFGKTREYQRKLVYATYAGYKQFLKKQKPDFAFFPLIEHYDSVVLYHLCLELRIKPVVYANARNIGLSYFTDSIYEYLPRYAIEDTPNGAHIEFARAFVESFRQKVTPAFSYPSSTEPAEVIRPPQAKHTALSRIWKVARRVASRIAGLRPIIGTMAEPHLVDTYTLLLKFKAYFLPVTVRVRRLLGFFALRHVDLWRLEEFPEKFVYFPLQFSPETSINIPAPYFVDQLRAIDLVLLAIPPNYCLVVKEHPVMQGIRETDFYRQLKKRGPVLLANPKIAGVEIVKRSSATVSVTGTACLEALFLGKPSAHIGRAFFSDWIGRIDSVERAKVTLRGLLRSSVPDSRAIDLVSRIRMIGGEFVLFSPDDPYHQYGQVMNKKNISRFVDHFITHIQREQMLKGDVIPEQRTTSSRPVS